jgi:Secretion system C-terminal sorting domain
MKNKILLLLFVLGSAVTAVAQVTKKVIVEHFTNTRCSACASRNPGFYSNYSNQSNALHIAYHPSSPYPTCVISQSNTAENDGRANYYGVYGGTPTLVIQGSPIPAGQSYSSAALFNPFNGQTSPVSISVSQINLNDSAEVRISIRTIAQTMMSDVTLFAALSEDTLNYDAPNGEDFHYDVFRKALLGNSGQAITLPAFGDSLVIDLKTWINPSWIRNQLSTLVILQETSNKSVIQAEKSQGTESEITSLQSIAKLNSRVFPNPSTDKLFITSDSQESIRYEIWTVSGQLVISGNFNQTTEIDVTKFNRGIYFLKLHDNSSEKMEKLILQ